MASPAGARDRNALEVLKAVFRMEVLLIMERLLRYRSQ